MYTNKGFTFVEVLLVIAILGVLVGLAIPFYQSFQVSSQLDNTTQEVAQTLRRAQARSMASEYFSPFGLHFESQKFVLFRGDTYIESDPFNEPVEVPGILSVSSVFGPDIVFSRVEGRPDVTGSITISTTYGKSRTININELGVINVL